MATFSLFSVFPIGVCLVTTGILYFMLFGRWVLPGASLKKDATSATSMKDYLKRIYGLKADIFEVEVPHGNILLGQTMADIMDAHHIYIIGSFYKGHRWVSPLVQTEITTLAGWQSWGSAETFRNWPMTTG